MSPLIRLTHLSASPLRGFVTPRTLGSANKPRGCLWLSPGNQWRDYIRRNSTSYDSMSYDSTSWRHRYTFVVRTERLIRISTVRDAKRFASEFGRRYSVLARARCDDPDGIKVTLDALEDRLDGFFGYGDDAADRAGPVTHVYRIDWDAVRARLPHMDGIFVEFRDSDLQQNYSRVDALQHAWYFGLHVPSVALWAPGCIVDRMEMR